MKKTISILLNLCLGLFLADGIVSVIDDSLQLFFGLYFLTLFSAFLTFITLLTTFVVYCLMAFFPMIPRRVILPIVLFYAVGLLVFFPVAIYGGGDYTRRCLQMDWVMSLLQVLLGLGFFYWIRCKFGRPLLEANCLPDRRFNWLNLSVFVLVNFLVVLPAAVLYLTFCAGLAIHHFTAGFVELRPRGLIVRVRQYTRSDGKQIELVPMAHIADADFYRRISASFPTNSIVLMEGVSDERRLLTNGISYKRMAHSLGLVEQRQDFKPQATLVMADIDVDQFSTNTIDLINLVMLIHAQGVNPATVNRLAQYSPPPNLEREFFDDVVNKRNRHLLETLQSELAYSDEIIVPWGAGHMPELATAIQAQGFHLANTEEYTVIGFHHR